MAKRNRPSEFDDLDDDQYDPVSDPPTLYELTDSQAIEAVKDWFLENFEDFAQVSAGPGAGGHQFVFGGPYETRDIIESAFYRRIRKDVRDAAIDEIERDSELWIPSEARRKVPDEEVHDGGFGTRAERHARMLESIRQLQEALKDLPPAPAGMGHNMPPEPLEVEPLDVTDRRELSSALETLVSQPVTPADAGSAGKAALEVVESKRAKLGNWLMKLGDVFTSEAAKEAGKEFGKWMPRAFFLFLADRFFEVSTLVKAWLTSFHLPF